MVVDKDGPYILEGAHRYDALGALGKKSFPAKVVIDRTEATGVKSGVPAERTPAIGSTPHEFSSEELKTGDTFVDDKGEPRRVVEVGEDGSIKTGDGTTRTYQDTIQSQEPLNSPKSRLAQGGKFIPGEGEGFEEEPQGADKVKLVDKKPERRAEFADAVRNTPGAEVNDDGSITLDISRRQHPDQGGARSPRSGVFFTPEADSPLARHYTGRSGYGGEQKVTEYGVTYKNPIVAKGSTGGKVPERVYDELKGKDAYDEMRTDVLDAAVSGMRTIPRDELISRIGDVLEKYGADRNYAHDIVDAPHKGNTLAYAVQEHIVAQAARDAGHDAILGFTTVKGQPRLSEVFDVNRDEFPYPGQAHVPNPLDLGEQHDIKSEPGYVYHATNAERLQDIADAGRLDVHRPDYGTDQNTWPDGSKEKRSYFTRNADQAWHFAPEEGRGAILRMKETPGVHSQESTGDTYARKPIKSKDLQYLADDGRWYPVTALVDER